MRRSKWVSNLRLGSHGIRSVASYSSGIQIYVLIIQRTTRLLTLPYAVKTSRPLHTEAIIVFERQDE